jgi:cellobiose-specific phosphotransferase system component IIC
MRNLLLPIGLLTTTLSSPAHAYLGPGMGVGTLAVVFGILASLVLALFAVLWYPFKRMINRLNGPKVDADTANNGRNEESTSNIPQRKDR